MNNIIINGRRNRRKLLDLEFNSTLHCSSILTTQNLILLSCESVDRTMLVNRLEDKRYCIEYWSFSFGFFFLIRIVCLKRCEKNELYLLSFVARKWVNVNDVIVKSRKRMPKPDSACNSKLVWPFFLRMHIHHISAAQCVRRVRNIIQSYTRGLWRIMSIFHTFGS